MPYIHFTDQQKEQAAGVDLAAFLESRGEKLVRWTTPGRWSFCWAKAVLLIPPPGNECGNRRNLLLCRLPTRRPGGCLPTW